MTFTARLLVWPVDCELSPADVVRRLSHRSRVTAWSGSWAGGSSIITCDPTRVVRSAVESFALLDDLPVVEADPSRPNAVGGGWFGYFGFHAAETSSQDHTSFGWYPDLLRHDGTSWHYEALVSHAFTETAAASRHAGLTDDLSTSLQPDAARLRLRSTPDSTAHVIAVERCIQAIRRGEIYQANICTQLALELDGSAYDAWGRLVDELQPARSALVVDPLTTAISASPELFLQRRGQSVLTAPIKGTRPRREGDDEDEVLRASVKDRAENVMIVDLMRNDLSRVSTVGSVTVPALLSVEAHPGVWHLVSYVRGELAPSMTNADLLRATFPPGSVTGAPKISAIQRISELESHPRHLYTGAMGFSSPLAGLELNVAIRTLEISDGRTVLGVGGAVTADSTPIEEWDECVTKAAPVLRVLGLDPCRLQIGRELAALSDPRRGVFETVLLADGRLHDLPGHLSRLRRSFWEAYRAPLTADLEGALAPVIGSMQLARVRVVACPSQPTRVEIQVHPCDRPVPLSSQPGVRLRVGHIGAMEHHKYVDRSWLMPIEAGLAAEEAVLFVDHDDVLLETNRSNIFVVQDGVVRTSPLDGRILPGVTRQCVLNAADDNGIALQIGILRLADLDTADGVFITNAIRRVQWVRQVGTRRWNAPDSTTRSIATLLTLP